MLTLAVSIVLKIIGADVVCGLNETVRLGTDPVELQFPPDMFPISTLDRPSI